MSLIDFIVGATITAILVVSIWAWPKYQCSVKAEKQGFEYSWGLVEGCMIKVDDNWIDYDKWRIME